MNEYISEKDLKAQFLALLDASPNLISALSNLSAFLYDALPDLNWAGFYLLHQGVLTLGPFCGKPACILIPPGKGVCGAALSSGRPLCVPDVHEFPGHIACDSASRSELVLPIRREGRAVAVLDLDSPLPGRFTERDASMLLSMVQLLESSPVWSSPAYDLI